MSEETVGGTPYIENNIIIWFVPRCLLPLEKGIRVWSPEFQFDDENESNFLFEYKNIQVPEGWIGLICENKYDYTFQINLRYKFGVVNASDKVINVCNGEWVQQCGVKGYFKVPNFFRKESVTNGQHVREHYLRIFCEAINKQDYQSTNTSGGSENESTIASPFNTVSTSKKEENWICGYCTFSNFVNKVYCEVCGIPNSAKQKYPAIASPFNSVSTSKKEENWICGYCTSSNSVNKVYCEVCGIPNSAKQKYPVTRRVCPLGLPMPEIFTSPRATNEASHNEKEIVSSSYCKKTNESKTIASPVSPTSAAIKENWECRRCTLINLADASNCEACNLPKSAEHKYLESSEKLISPVGNPATPDTNLPLCIICFNKERNIVFQPCGHLITCNDCADFRMDNCPLCRKDIQNKLKTFIN